MFEFLKKKKKKSPADQFTEAVEKEKQARKKKTPKEIATEKGEPYIAILGMEVDYENLASGSIELDWNEKFVSNLIRAGYQGKTDADIVDLWFQNVCRNIVMETYEQEQAINSSSRFTQSRDLGNGRREVS